MIVVALVALAFVVAFLRRRRNSTLAGLNSERPTFSLLPAKRWSTSGRDHRL